MWDLCMHPDYDHLYIPLTYKKGKFQPQTNIFFGNNNSFSIKLTVVWVRISEKRNYQFFRFEISLPQASKYKETCFATRKILQNFERHDHWH